VSWSLNLISKKIGMASLLVMTPAFLSAQSKEKPQAPVKSFPQRQQPREVPRQEPRREPRQEPRQNPNTKPIQNPTPEKPRNFPQIPSQPRREEPRVEPRKEEPRRVEPRVEPRREEPRHQEPRKEEPRREQPRREFPRQEEPRRQEPRKEEPRREEPRRDFPGRVNPGQNNPRPQEPRRQEPRREDPRRVEPRRDIPGHGGVSRPAPNGRSYDRDRDPWMRNRIENGRSRMHRLREDPRMHEHIRFQRDEFRRRHCEPIVIRRDSHIRVCETNRGWYKSYRRYGFHGGFYYRYHPVTDVTIYLGNPLWGWFYLDTVSVDVQVAWYGTSYATYPVRDFKYRRIYNPTVEFRDLIIGVSDLDSYTQYNFREGMSNLTDQLGQKLANIFGRQVSLDENDVVINNYQVIEDKAVVVQGYVEKGGVQFGFKGFINLRNPADVMLFVPSGANSYPTYEEIRVLENMNTRILDLGGTVDREEVDDWND